MSELEIDPGIAFLHERDPKLHTTPDIELAADYLRAHGDAIPNQPVDKLTSYMGLLAHEQYANDGVLTGDPESIERQAEFYSIDVNADTADAYFKFQSKISREQGIGIDENNVSDETKEEKLRVLQQDQKQQLTEWMTYLNGPDVEYEDWFKKYVIDSVTKLAAFDQAADKFPRRGARSFALFPELDAESLSLTYDVLKAKISKWDLDGYDLEMQTAAQSGNFGKIYKEANKKGFAITEELRAVETGSWKTYLQSDKSADSDQLAEDVSRYRSGWCTGGKQTAHTQLSNGDFYVWYSTGSDGQDNVPRIAVRMEGGKVREVRGIGDNQEMEPELIDVAMDKIRELPGGEEYTKKAEDMKRLTQIDKRVNEDPGDPLEVEDLMFLYQVNGRIKGFGQDFSGEDPRIKEVIEKRDRLADLKLIQERIELKIKEGQKLSRGETRFASAYQVFDILISHTENSDDIADSELSIDNLRFLYEVDPDASFEPLRLSFEGEYSTFDLKERMEKFTKGRDKFTDVRRIYEAIEKDRQEGAVQSREDAKFIRTYPDLVRTLEIDAKTSVDPRVDLSKDDLRFLYEIDRPITLYTESTGSRHFNSRLGRIRDERDTKADYAEIFDCTPEQVMANQHELTDDSVVLVGRLSAEYLRKGWPKRLRFIAGDVDFGHFDQEPRNLEEIIGTVQLTHAKIKSLGSIRRIRGKLFINDNEFLEDLGSLEEVVGDIDFQYTVIPNLGMLRHVTGDIKARRKGMDFSGVKVDGEIDHF